ncbi:MAG: hypothetical protein IPK67_06465 [Planctomycetes bacterium]|nr:hypothetical protein [Planctomycetota bacterium]
MKLAILGTAVVLLVAPFFLIAGPKAPESEALVCGTNVQQSDCGTEVAKLAEALRMKLEVFDYQRLQRAVDELLTLNAKEAYKRIYEEKDSTWVFVSTQFGLGNYEGKHEKFEQVYTEKQIELKKSRTEFFDGLQWLVYKSSSIDQAVALEALRAYQACKLISSPAAGVNLSATLETPPGELPARFKVHMSFVAGINYVRDSTNAEIKLVSCTLEGDPPFKRGAEIVPGKTFDFAVQMAAYGTGVVQVSMQKCGSRAVFLPLPKPPPPMASKVRVELGDAVITPSQMTEWERINVGAFKAQFSLVPPTAANSSTREFEIRMDPGARSAKVTGETRFEFSIRGITGLLAVAIDSPKGRAHLWLNKAGNVGGDKGMGGGINSEHSHGVGRVADNFHFRTTESNHYGQYHPQATRR